MFSFFRIRNFRSILDMTVNFSFAEKRAPAGFAESETVFFIEPKKRVRLVPVLALYGSNASGKSNVLMALHTFRECVLSGIEGKFHPDKLHPAQDASTVFEASFETQADGLFSVGHRKKVSGVKSASYGSVRLHRRRHRRFC